MTILIQRKKAGNHGIDNATCAMYLCNDAFKSIPLFLFHIIVVAPRNLSGPTRCQHVNGDDNTTTVQQSASAIYQASDNLIRKLSRSVSS